MKNILGLCLLALVGSSSAFSQAVAGFGAVTGTIRDPYGDGLPDTTVVLSNPTLGIQRTMTTTDDGVFDAPGLAPGPGYDLKASHVGYTTWESKDVRISLGETMNFKIVLQAPQRNATVQAASTATVTGAVKFEVSTLAASDQIDALPTNDRRLESLVPLAPAITEDSSGVLAFRGEGFTNAFFADGLLASNTYFYRQSGIAPYVTEDAVSEMQTISATGSAEFGHSAGGFVNAATHVGTDSVHGSAYEYYNTQGLNAANRYDPAFHPTTKQNQYGLSAGGQAIPKLFWFFNGEVVSGESQGVNLIFNPLIGNAAGTAVPPSNCGSAATAAQCTAAIAFINAQMNRVVARSNRSDTGLAKLDYRLNQSNNFSLEAAAMHAHAPNGSVNQQVANNGGLLGNNGTYTDETRFARAAYTAAPASNTVNEIRAGWYHDRFSDYEDAALLPSTGALGITVAGTPIGGNPAYPMVISEQRYQFMDVLTSTSGNHLLKFGAEYIRNQDKTAQIYGRAGTYDFPTLTAFAEDFTGNTLQHRDYNDFTQGFGQPVVTVKTQGLVAYAQDIWRPLPRLTVDFGVHWEKALFPKPAYTSVSFYETGSVPSASTDFSPRAGLAYQLDGHTVVRLGFGSYYQPYSGELLESLFTGNGINQAYIALNPNQTGNLVFPKIFATNITAFPSGSQNIVYPFNKFRNPYTEQATLAIERNLGRDTTFSIGVMQSRGVKLWTQIDQNLAGYSSTKVYTIDNAGGVPTGSYYFSSMWTAKPAGTTFAHVYEIDNSGASRYNAAVAQVRKRMSHGLGVQLSYTWSHAIDNVGGPPVLGGAATATYIPGDYRDDQGNSSFDQRHRGVINWTWQPKLASDSSVARYLVNGWQISGILTLASGLPETPVVIVNGQQFASGANNGTPSITMEYVNSLNGSGGWNRVPFENVSSLRTSAQYVLDARVAKVLPFTDRVKGIVMFEAFNALNKQYSTSLDTIAYTATLGVLRPVAGVGAGTAADGYPYGTNARRAQVAFRIVF